MQDIKKSGIIEELAELKNRLADLTEKQPDEATETTQATDSLPSLDLSNGGIGFELEEDIPFDMEFEIAGNLHQHRAYMVWMQRLENGCSHFGFQFITGPTSSLLWLYKE